MTSPHASQIAGEVRGERRHEALAGGGENHALGTRYRISVPDRIVLFMLSVTVTSRGANEHVEHEVRGVSVPVSRG